MIMMMRMIGTKTMTMMMLLLVVIVAAAALAELATAAVVAAMPAIERAAAISVAVDESDPVGERDEKIAVAGGDRASLAGEPRGLACGLVLQPCPYAIEFG